MKNLGHSCKSRATDSDVVARHWLSDTLYSWPSIGAGLSAILLICFASTAVAATAAANGMPNIVLILADDIGVETIGAYGSEHETPAIDALAANGIRYENAYAMPLCTPSRVRMLTGKHSYRNYRTFADLDPEEYTIAELLREAGYATLVSGKWQLAGNGVDDFIGSLPDDAGFDEHLAWYFEREQKGARYWQPTLINDGVRDTYCPQDFGPDLLNERVLEFIGRERESPFFVMYSMLLAHDPWVNPPGRSGLESEQEQFGVMITYMDGLVGRVVSHLEDRGLLRDTVILFIGDNGTTRGMTSRRHGVEVTGMKGYTPDSGIHVPFILHWPERVPRGRVSHDLVDIIDVFRTLSAAADLEPPADRDGVNLLDYLSDDNRSLPRSSIFMHYDSRWQHPPKRLIFDARWKLYGDGRFFDTQADPLEQSPLSREELVGKSAAIYDQFSARLSDIDDGELTEPPRPEPGKDIPQVPTLRCGSNGKAMEVPFSRAND